MPRGLVLVDDFLVCDAVDDARRLGERLLRAGFVAAGDGLSFSSRDRNGRRPVGRFALCVARLLNLSAIAACAAAKAQGLDSDEREKIPLEQKFALNWLSAYAIYHVSF